MDDQAQTPPTEGDKELKRMEYYGACAQIGTHTNASLAMSGASPHARMLVGSRMIALAIAEVKSNYGDKNASEMVAELEMSWEIMKQQLGGADAETSEKEAV